jgi:hypothetical protein
MRIFLAGATGVIGVRLVPLLVAGGHEVMGMTRSPANADRLAALGAQSIVCDVFDPGGLARVVTAVGPDLVMHQLTDLPDSADQIGDYRERNDRMRSEGTRNLIAAAGAARVEHLMAQSIAWELPSEHARDVVAAHERMVLDGRGLVIRYGQFYGPGTFFEGDPPPPPRIQIDQAAERTVALLDTPPGIVTVVEDQS